MSRNHALVLLAFGGVIPGVMWTLGTSHERGEEPNASPSGGIARPANLVAPRALSARDSLVEPAPLDSIEVIEPSVVDVPEDELQQVDAAGATNAQRRDFLLNAYAYMVQRCESESSPGWDKTLVQRMFMLRCVGTILHFEGRANFPDLMSEADLKRFHSTIESQESDPDRITFGSDGALYEFWKGEFPDFDEALRRLEEESGWRFNLENEGPVERLFSEALATFSFER